MILLGGNTTGAPTLRKIHALTVELHRRNVYTWSKVTRHVSDFNKTVTLVLLS